MWLQRGRHFSWGSYPLTGGFETRDGAIVLVGAFKTNPLRDICAALGLTDLSSDPRYATFTDQVAHKSELQAMFRERFASNTTEYWLARLDEQDLLCAPVLTLADALGHEQTKANGTVVTLEGNAGAIPLIGTPLTMAEGAFQLRRAPPALGADGDAVLSDAGYSSERIAALRQSGIVR
jgi:crotonobetainyl-CoA:carnitine CoA-transferase CaiB-like acyl-CoA transferase